MQANSQPSLRVNSFIKVIIALTLFHVQMRDCRCEPADLSEGRFEAPTLLFGQVSGSSANEGGPLHTLQRMSNSATTNLTLLSPFLSRDEPTDLTLSSPIKRHQVDLAAEQFASHSKLQDLTATLASSTKPLFLASRLSKTELVAAAQKPMMELQAAKFKLRGLVLDSVASPTKRMAALEPSRDNVERRPELIAAAPSQGHPIELTRAPQHEAPPLGDLPEAARMPLDELRVASSPGRSPGPLAVAARPAAPLTQELNVSHGVHGSLSANELVPHKNVSGLLQAPKSRLPEELTATALSRQPLSVVHALAAPEIKVRARPIEPLAEDVQTELRGKLKPPREEAPEAKRAVAYELKAPKREAKFSTQAPAVTWDDGSINSES